MRRFDPADQRSIGKAGSFTLMPASEALLDEETVKRFRARYREQFGANATGDPLYQAISDGRRLAGMEHWLPLLEEKLATLSEHLGEDDVISSPDAGGKRAANVGVGGRSRRRHPSSNPVPRSAHANTAVASERRAGSM